jgi:hypothetical protein
MQHATCHAMSDLDEAANQDSALTTSTTVFVTVYGKGNKITRTKMTCDFIRFPLNRILVMVFRRKIRIGLTSLLPDEKVLVLIAVGNGRTHYRISRNFVPHGFLY